MISCQQPKPKTYPETRTAEPKQRQIHESSRAAADKAKTKHFGAADIADNCFLADTQRFVVRGHPRTRFPPPQAINPRLPRTSADIAQSVRFGRGQRRTSADKPFSSASEQSLQPPARSRHHQQCSFQPVVQFFQTCMTHRRDQIHQGIRSSGHFFHVQGGVHCQGLPTIPVADSAADFFPHPVVHPQSPPELRRWQLVSAPVSLPGPHKTMPSKRTPAHSPKSTVLRSGKALSASLIKAASRVRSPPANTKSACVSQSKAVEAPPTQRNAPVSQNCQEREIKHVCKIHLFWSHAKKHIENILKAK